MKFENCIQCAVGRLISFTSFLGFPCVKYSCRHIDGTKAQITLYHSKPRLIIGLCVMFTLMVVCGLNGKNIKFALHQNNAFFNATIYITDLVLLISSIMVMAVSMLRINTIIDVINSAQDIVDKWQEHTSKILLSKTDTFKLRTRIYRQIFAGALLAILIVILFIMDSDPTWSTAEKAVTFASIYANIMFAAFVDIVSHLYMFIYVSYGNQLKTELIKRFYVYENLSNLLVSYGQLHIRLKRLAVLFNTFLNPSSLMWLLTGVMLLISTTFLILMCFLESKSNLVTSRLIVILVIISFTGCIIINLVVTAARILKMGREQLEFLYGYPVISNLTYQEAIKFEILKTFFIKLQSTFTISEMVLVDMELIAAITGTVLTFVVIAIQFELIIWNQK